MLLFCGAFSAAPALAQKRVALVIGNGGYQHTAHLKNPVNDAEDMATALQRLGFHVGPTREFLCFRSFQRPAIMSWLFKHWCYSRADTLR